MDNYIEKISRAQTWLKFCNYFLYVYSKYTHAPQTIWFNSWLDATNSRKKGGERIWSQKAFFVFRRHVGERETTESRNKNNSYASLISPNDPWHTRKESPKGSHSRNTVCPAKMNRENLRNERLLWDWLYEGRPFYIASCQTTRGGQKQTRVN